MAINVSAVPQSLSLSEAVTQAVHHITFSLNGRLPEETLRKLQFLLVSNLSTHFAPSWDPTDPTKGSGRRCLLFSQNCPPRLVHAACVAAGVAWQDWARALRHPDFELFVNPGCIFARYGEWGTPSFHVTTLWEPRLSEADIQSQIRSQATAKLAAATDARKVKEESPKTLAQQLLEEDQEQIGEEILALIAHEVREPTWLTPILDKFPVPSAPPKYLCPPRREDSVSPVSTHSRSSSSSDNSESSEFSFSSSGSSSSMTSVSSAGSMEKKSDAEKLMSRREKARQARVFIDKNKKEVTSYEGGRTTVLTGGVMLGGPAKPKVYQAPKPSRAAAPTSPACWRRL
ncbi:hypothetical protein GLOTRDRAFT_109234 [Gloeophyllum trabeum ATCC 11539]|uniref:Anti-proliferative protein domain-containing protein n=1 Tax=Gloeophyllum trabeum (strain ATCC 11539 / FP-39264 / Madison 617) TaxID=670483 RepID=S7QN28_GLOTA|nr:uncharacterized protein GLOTRDRAFT_109234 [Gloeophyllum trabeum ATCC 11539]EPQ60961.1 hypothetical protein GLOTRDRAFT_109234 [Gloeophyllum trabeum ATCC 11539]